jgi:Protein of unknown function (DUF3352)
MSSETPPPGSGPNPDDRRQPPPYPPVDAAAGSGAGSPGPETISYRPGAAGGSAWPGSEPTRPGGRRVAKVAILTAVLAVIFGGGAFAFVTLDPLHLFRAGPQAAQALPGDALGYAAIDLDPSAQQEIEALRFLNHFPGFREGLGVTDESADIRKIIFDKILASNPCPGLSYDADLKPWIGSKFGLAVMAPPPGSSEPGVVAAIQTTGDHASAEAGLTKLVRCDHSVADARTGHAFVGSYLLIAKTQRLADTYATDAERSSLADNPKFSADMHSLGELGVATGWVNVAQALHAFGPSMGSGLAAAGAGNRELSGLTSSFQRVATTIRFADGQAEDVFSVYGDAPTVAHEPNRIVDLPDSTVFAVSASGGQARVTAGWDRLRNLLGQGSGPGLDEQLALLQARTGLKLPDDLATILGHNILFAVDGHGLSAAALHGDTSRLNAGVRLNNDPVELNRIYAKVLRLGRSLGITPKLAKKDFPDGIAIASNNAYAKKMGLLNGHLGDNSAFSSVITDGANQDFALFLNWDAIEPQIVQASTAGGAPKTLIDNLRPLRAVGITSAQTGGHYSLITARVSVD